MRLDFDPAKSLRNAEERGLPFTVVGEFVWETALVKEDVRHAYPERRFMAFGYIGVRLHAVCFTPVAEGVRVISLRKANAREREQYEART